MKLSAKFLLVLSLSVFSTVHADDFAIFNYVGGLGEKYFKLESPETHVDHVAADSNKPSDETNKKLPKVVIDYDVISNVTFKFNSAPRNNLNEGFSLKQSGEILGLIGVSSGSLILKATPAISNEHLDVEHKIKTRDVLYTVSFEDALSVMAPVKGGMANQKIENKILTFEVGDLTNLDAFDINLFAQKKRVVLSDVTLIDRSLKVGEYQVTALPKGRSLVTVDLEKVVGSFDLSKKHVFKFSVKLKHDFTNTINSKQIGPTVLADQITLVD